ncbi:MAG: C10 family peptidase [Muribaculaceae bacterium]|nr:C10 family peptidase [Muribaculaceae bacterium]
MDIERHEYSLEDYVSDSTLTRANIINADPFEIQTVKLDFGDTQGYSIVSDDDRLNRVFFYTESGNISDTTFIQGLKETIREYPLTASILILNDIGKETRANEIKTLVNQLVRFEWHQGEPFNNYAPYCNCSKCISEGNHMPIGCAAIAVAQTIATLGTFKGSFYGTRDLDFSKLPNQGWQMTGVQKVQIAQFLHDIALNCQMKFSCDGSATYPEAVYNYLSDLGYNCTFVKNGTIDSAKMLDLLLNGIPQLMAGSNKSVGHMWIVDGMRLQNGAFDYHCNWGWGSEYSNGWSIGNEYTDSSGINTYPKNKSYIYINSKLK